MQEKQSLEEFIRKAGGSSVPDNGRDPADCGASKGQSTVTEYKNQSVGEPVVRCQSGSAFRDIGVDRSEHGACNPYFSTGNLHAGGPSMAKGAYNHPDSVRTMELPALVSGAAKPSRNTKSEWPCYSKIQGGSDVLLCDGGYRGVIGVSDCTDGQPAARRVRLTYEPTERSITRDVVDIDLFADSTDDPIVGGPADEEFLAEMGKCDQTE